MYRPYKSNRKHDTLRTYTFSQLVSRWKPSRNDKIEVHRFLSDLTELGMPGLASFTTDTYNNIYNIYAMDTVLDNVESFCLSLKEDFSWPIHFQKWVNRIFGTGGINSKATKHIW